MKDREEISKEQADSINADPAGDKWFEDQDKKDNAGMLAAIKGDPKVVTDVIGEEKKVAR